MMTICPSDPKRGMSIDKKIEWRNANDTQGIGIVYLGAA